MEVPSKKQVKKAGSTLRKYLRGELEDEALFLAALDTMEDWRRAHSQPMVMANNDLRLGAEVIGVEAEVTQRLKRSQTILDKLGRQPTLDLSRMQDIGGCRAVVNGKDDLRRLEEQILTTLTPVTHTDYITCPRESGYRGVHLVVHYQERCIEIQLRTETMHEWALAAEQFSSVFGRNLKQDGNHPVQEFLKVAAEMMSLLEDGLDVPQDMATLHEERRIAALSSLEGGA
jgi:ppGpp synthetase/RelA/SpoT-type nucleotidyltranferase